MSVMGRARLFVFSLGIGGVIYALYGKQAGGESPQALASHFLPKMAAGKRKGHGGEHDNDNF